jgi:hypothetical protein
MVPQHLGARALFLVYGSSPRLNKCSFSSYPLKAKYVELLGKGKGYNSSYVYWLPSERMVQKELRKICQWFGKGFWNRMMEGEKMESYKKEFLKLKCFSPLKILTSPFIWRDSWSFLSFFLSFSSSFSLFFFYAPSLSTWGFLWY